MSAGPARFTIRSLLLLGVALQASAAAAQSRPSGETEPAAGRVLNEHVFLPADDVRGALVTTSFASGLLVGYGSTTASQRVGDQTYSGTFEYAGVGAVIDYEYAFTDNLSARAMLTEIIYSGITGRSAVVIGSNIQGGLGAGVTYSRPIGQELRVGALLDVSDTPNFGLTLGRAIRGVIDSCQGPSGTAGCTVQSGTVFQAKHVLTLEPALAASWAPLPALGLTANLAYLDTHQTINEVDHEAGGVSIGVAADYDFGAISKVPVGLQAQFSWTAPTGSGVGLQHVTDLGGGIFYTGRPHLALGVQVLARRFAVAPDVDVSWSTYLADVGLRYYW